MGVLSTGITGLNAFRSQLTTTAHNVANVNTEGYSRQVVGLSTLPPTLEGVGYVGTGVQVSEIRRQFDAFLMDRVRVHTASKEDFQVYLDRASRVDDLIADPDAGLSGAMQMFFNAVQDVADGPTSTATRDVMLSSANVLADRFHAMHDFLEGLRSEINQDLEVLVGEANSLTESIAQLNHEIQLAVNGTGDSPNDLLDRRDQVITQLSELVSVTTVAQDNGAINVFLGNGQGVVIGARSFTLATTINNAEPDRLDVTLESGGGNASVITNFLSGGKFGGYFRFRENVLDPTENALGRLAMGLGTFFNEQHQLGMDLNGALGKEMFNVPDPTDPTDVYGQQMLALVQGSASITNINVAELSTADYELRYDGSWNLYDRSLQTSQVVVPNAANEIIFDGITLNVGAPGTWTLGDNFIIKPTRLAARAFNVEINDAREIAAASPVAVTKNVVGINSTAEISDSGLISPLDPAADFTGLPITLTYNAGGLTVSGGTVTPATYNAATDSGGTYVIDIPNLGDFSFKITGTLSDGDTFDFDYNPSGVGDNRNALELAALQTDKTMRNDTSGQPTSSFVGLYSSMIGDVGSKTRQAMINTETQSRLKEQSVTAMDEVSGVNLDEEAANLVHFQQAYQAATQVIRVSNQLFDSLLNAF